MSLQDVSLSSDDNDVVMVPPHHQTMHDDPEVTQRLLQVQYQLGFLQNSVQAVQTDVSSLRSTVDQLTGINMQLSKQINHLDEHISRMHRSYDSAKEEIKVCKRRLFISAVVLAAAAIIRLHQ